MRPDILPTGTSLTLSMLSVKANWLSAKANWMTHSLQAVGHPALHKLLGYHPPLER